MKRWFFIIGGIIITLLITAWVYLLINGTPTREELFSAFPFSDSEEGDLIITENPTLETFPTEAGKQALRQLTVKRVAGYTEVQTAGTAPALVYFVEAGTGHIYTISPDGQNENRVSNITVPQTIEAAIAPDGSYAALRTTDSSSLTIVVLPHESKELQSFTLPETVLPGFLITTDGILLFTTRSGSGLVGKRFSLGNNQIEVLFSIPFSEGKVIWGKTATGSHYVYPKTNRSLEGYLYEIKNNSLTRLPAAGFGFGANSNGDYTIFMKQVENTFRGYLFAHASNTTQELVFTLIPEKCAFLHSNSKAVCAYSDVSNDITFPDSWYKGISSFSDEIWQVSLSPSETTFVSLVDTLSVSGREIDIIKPTINHTDTLFYFKNKNDQTLWVFDLTIVLE